MRLRIPRILWTFVLLIISVDVLVYLYNNQVVTKESPRSANGSSDDTKKHSCVPGVPCGYSDKVDFRIILMTFNRAKALSKTLTALNDLELDGDSAAIEIWIDRDKDEKVDAATVKTAKAFKVCREITFDHCQGSHLSPRRPTRGSGFMHKPSISHCQWPIPQ